MGIAVGSASLKQLAPASAGERLTATLRVGQPNLAVAKSPQPIAQPRGCGCTQPDDRGVCRLITDIIGWVGANLADWRSCP